MAADEVERGVEEALLQEVERKQQQQLGAGSAAPGFPGPSSHVQNVFWHAILPHNKKPKRNMNPEPHFLILFFFKNRMRKTSIRVPGSIDLFLSRNRCCLCTSVVAASKWDFEHVYKVIGLVFLQHTHTKKKRDVRTVRTEDMWAGIKWAGGSGREMGSRDRHVPVVPCGDS
jgi:hypothetical protein